MDSLMIRDVLPTANVRVHFPPHVRVHKRTSLVRRMSAMLRRLRQDLMLSILIGGRHTLRVQQKEYLYNHI